MSPCVSLYSTCSLSPSPIIVPSSSIIVAALPHHSSNVAFVRLIPAPFGSLCWRIAIHSASARTAWCDHSVRIARRPLPCITTVRLSVVAARTRAITARIRCQNGRSCSGSRDTASARIAHERLLRGRRHSYHRCGSSSPTCWKNNSTASPAAPLVHRAIPAVALSFGRVSFPSQQRQRALSFPIVFSSSPFPISFPSSASLRCGGV